MKGLKDWELLSKDSNTQKYAKPDRSCMTAKALSFIFTSEEEQYLVITITEPFLSKNQVSWFSCEEWVNVMIYDNFCFQCMWYLFDSQISLITLSFLDATASPISYPCEWVSESVSQ